MLKKFIAYYKPYKGLFLLDLLMATLTSALSVCFPVITRRLLNIYIPNLAWTSILTCFLLMLFIYIAESICSYVMIKWGHILGVCIETDIRHDFFVHLQKLSVSFYDTTKTGHLMSRMTNDLFEISETAHHCPENLIISGVTIILSLVVMFRFSVPLALFTVLPIPFLLFWALTMGSRLKKSYKAVKVKVAELNSNVENSLQGIREVKSYSRESYQQNLFDTVNGKVKDSKKAQYTAMAKYHALMKFFRELCYFSTVCGGVFLIAKGMATVQDLVTFLLFVSIILPPIDRLIDFAEQFQAGAASFERFLEVMAVQPSIEERKDAKDLHVGKGTITFKDVSFSYEKGGTVLDRLNLTIDGGKRVAIVGESGAGKTTIASLLCRFYEPTEGSILIDGQDISCVTQRSLHEAIGYVQQEPFLFDATVRENLRYGKMDASDEEMQAALEAANLSSFIASLPSGLDSEVGERGTRLSGGQKQRLAIARMFLKNPSILIFDEATSSLDNESESLITEAFSRLSKGRTALVIAHRLSTIKNAEAIVVIDKGKVAEEGSEEELLGRDSLYRKLYQAGR